jgi:hypothetical protein
LFKANMSFGGYKAASLLIDNTLIENQATFSGGFSIAQGAANGKVLTSDANGVGTWQTAAGGPTIIANTQPWDVLFNQDVPESATVTLYKIGRQVTLAMDGILAHPNGAITAPFSFAVSTNSLPASVFVPGSTTYPSGDPNWINWLSGGGNTVPVIFDLSVSGGPPWNARVNITQLDSSQQLPSNTSVLIPPQTISYVTN